MNWKLRLKNKTTLISLITLVISLVYKVLDLCGVIPPFPAEKLVEIGSIFIDVLCLLGIVVDPTTHGIRDSAQAMTYEEPKKEGEHHDDSN